MYKLILLWETGEKETYNYNTRDEAQITADNMKMCFGNQISWYGISEII